MTTLRPGELSPLPSASTLRSFSRGRENKRAGVTPSLISPASGGYRWGRLINPRVLPFWSLFSKQRPISLRSIRPTVVGLPRIRYGWSCFLSVLYPLQITNQLLSSPLLTRPFNNHVGRIPPKGVPLPSASSLRGFPRNRRWITNHPAGGLSITNYQSTSRCSQIYSPFVPVGLVARSPKHSSIVGHVCFKAPYAFFR